MELLAVDSEGVATIIRDNQSTIEAGFSTPFVINNRNSMIYYIESDKVFGAPLGDPYNSWVSECDVSCNRELQEYSSE